MSTLKQLYNGEICPGEDTMWEDKEYLAIADKINREREYLKSKLSEEDAERFEKMSEMQIELCAMRSFADFENGFQLGVKLIGEVYFRGQ